MELAKSIIELISSICVLGGVIWMAYKAVALFHYKYDAEIRNMYIENCRNVRNIMGKVMTTGEIDEFDCEGIKINLQDAMLFLHEDVVKFVSQVYNIITSLKDNKISLEDTFEGPDRKIRIEKREVARNTLVDLNRKSLLIYRKHIVKDRLTSEKLEKILNIGNDKK